MVFRESQIGERDAMDGWRWRALRHLRDQTGVEFAEEEDAFLDTGPQYNVVLTRQIEDTRFP